ncbi:hypothetical protein GH714_040234 [Hevea brasiliensis]|uniref:Uncharacterized protein n=1 Tax=Hevea brasiliensis TaxID=3981 RepID=A0A6A6MT06_HEVBR|nr:hypothetical protein GH714_040234 [Hevea brasiliensis]
MSYNIRRQDSRLETKTSSSLGRVTKRTNSEARESGYNNRAKDRYHAHILFDHLSSPNPVAHVQICNALSRSSSGAGIDSKDTISSLGHRSFVDLTKELFQMLATIGPYLYRDIILLQKIGGGESFSKTVNTAGSIKTPKQDLAKEDSKSGKAVGRTPSTSSVSTTARGLTSSARTFDGHGGELKVDNGAAKSVSGDKLQRRTSPAEDPDRLSKRWKGDSELRDLEGEVRFSNRERPMDARLVDLDKTGTDEQSMHRSIYKVMDRLKDKGNERYDREYSERSDHPDKSRGDDILLERSTDRSMERYGREHSVERGQERGADRNFDWPSDKAKHERNKDDRSKLRYGDTSMEEMDISAASKRRKLKREQLSLGEAGEYSPVAPPPPPLPIGMSQSYDGRDRGDRKGAMI